MQAELWRKVEELYHAAMSEPAEKRAEFLDRACSDAHVRAEVQSLLNQADGSFLERSPLPSMVRPGMKLGNFELVGRIGRGGMGEVWRAHDPRLKRNVAIKLLPAAFARDPERIARFEHEAWAASALNHPNIVSVFDIGHENGTWWIVSELVDGESLSNLIRRGPLQVRHVVEIGIQIAEGLAATHAAGIVHRDLKPGNIMLRRDGGVKIVDFGLAKHERPTQESAELTDSGAIVGTAGYMAPEQVRGKTVDARSDIFSFGVILYEMLSGRQAFTGTSSVEVMNAILNDEPAELTGLPSGLDRIVRHCMEKQRDRRFQSAADIAFALSSLSLATPAERNVLNHRRWPWIAVAAALAITVLVRFWWRAPRPAAEPIPVRLTSNGPDQPVNAAAISPDGKYLAYSDHNGVYVKSMQSTGMRLLPNTERMSVRYWSTDSSKIFVADIGDFHRIYSVSPLGDNPRPLGDTLPFPDGRHVFHFTDNAVEIKRPDGNLSFALPRIRGRIVPGLDFLAVSSLQDPKGWSIDAFQLDTGRRTTLLPPQPRVIDAAWWLTESRLIFALSDGPVDDLWVLDVNPRSGLPTKAPVHLTRWADSAISHLSATADGKGVCFLRTRTEANIWVGTLSAHGAKLTGLRRFTDDEAYNRPWSWTPDSKTVVFTSDRSSRFQVYRQNIDDDKAEVLTTGEPLDAIVRCSPDGRWLVYAVWETNRIMRIPVPGGEPEQILAGVGVQNLTCSRLPGGVCEMEEEDGNASVISLFDPVKGRGPRLFRIDKAILPNLSPDGNRLAYLVPEKQTRRIRITDLHGGTQAEILLSAADDLDGLDWTADGSGFFTSDLRVSGETRLLHVEGSGASQVLWTVPGHVGLFGVPSPDGRYLATFKDTSTANVWMFENP